jgi:sugar phosphate isomerase/epimerase
MELGCNSYSLRASTRDAAFARMRALGFDAVELWIGHVRDASDDPQRVALEMRRHGLAARAYCIGGLFGLPPAEAERRLDAAFRFATALGTDLVTGIVDRALVPTVDRRCRAHGTRFAIENHWYTELARPRDYEVLDACSPAVGVNIDSGHFAFLGCDLTRVAETLGPRTLNVHLKVVRPESSFSRWRRRRQRDYRMTALPPGPADGLDAFVGALRRSGYDGMLAIEHESDRADAELASFRARGVELLRDAAQTEAA